MLPPGIIAGTLLALAIGTARDAHAAPGPGARGAQILDFARKWLGTRYQWGGNGRAGIDCSAYLRRMYREVFAAEIPRTTRQQIGRGMPLKLNTTDPEEGLHPGDVIFYIGKDGQPTHVVVYAGNNTITHSVRGRGVVIDPLRKILGRRLVARRYLVPRFAGGEPRFAPTPPVAGPIEVQELPCPPTVRARRSEVRRFRKHRLSPADLRPLAERELCEFRALAHALKRDGGEIARENARALENYAAWIQSIEALKDILDGGS